MHADEVLVVLRGYLGFSLITSSHRYTSVSHTCELRCGLAVRLLISVHPVRTDWNKIQPISSSVDGCFFRHSGFVQFSRHTRSLCIYLLFPLLSLNPSIPRLVCGAQRRIMFGLSVRLLVSVSGAAGSSDSAGGAAGPSRVQPSPCDTLSVTDPLRLVTWHPLLPHPRLRSLSPTSPPRASGLFTATPQSVSHSSQSLTASRRTP